MSVMRRGLGLGSELVILLSRWWCFVSFRIVCRDQGLTDILEVICICCINLCGCIRRYARAHTHVNCIRVSFVAVSLHALPYIQFVAVAVRLLTNCFCTLSDHLHSVGVYKYSHLGSSQI
jgi:hypothetical protein